MRKKGFTLVELLVVIAIIAMLLAILMPALAKVKTLAYQMLCGTNLKGVANAILVYSQDNNEKYPVAGISGVTWSMGALGWNWDQTAKPDPTAATSKQATVSSCLYLLVKYADVSPASFVCKASKQKKLNITASQADTDERSAISTDTTKAAKDAVDCWDFSKIPSRYCSYSYAYPWDTSRTLTSASKAGLAVAADLNPWIGVDPCDTKKVKFLDPCTPAYDAATPGYDAPQLIKAGTADKLTWVTGNSVTHEQAGQNVLFNDMHVEFAKQPHPDSSIQNDNIYTTWDNSKTAPGQRGRGIQPKNNGATDATMRPWTKEDSYLVQW